MDNKELRIGNWVFDLEEKENTEVIQWTFESDYFTSLEPIPLTEEWLIRFEEVEKAPYDDDIKDYYLIKRCGFFDIIYEDDDNIYIDFGDALKKVKYLHQLQNLYFALTNEELTIK